MKVLAWVAAALTASALLLAVLQWEHRYARARWANFLVGDPHQGSHLFREKGCAHCHAVNGAGGKLGPELGFERSPRANLNQLVSAMWNHAPRMWRHIEAEKVPYPDFDYEEMAHLFAYLYTARYVDEVGNAHRGQLLFESKSCSRCHSFYESGGKAGPSLTSVGSVYTPIAWSQAMWNHAPAMEAEMHKQGLAWPEFRDQEMSDLLAYLRERCAGPRQEFELLPADPERGWQLFQNKSCIACHAVRGEGGRIGPELAARAEPPLTIVQFAGLMWNHSPKMIREMQARDVARPHFTGREMADLIAFLHSIRYFEPGGSPQMGGMLFTRRGCGNCHGSNAEGAAEGPPLRGRGKTYTSVTLAVALWRHGPEMHQRAQQLSQPWPTLLDSDVGDLVIFLSTPPSENRSQLKPNGESVKEKATGQP